MVDKTKIYGLIDETGRLLFEYTTNQGNRKKAFFSTQKSAEEALDNYVKDYYENKKWTVVIVGERSIDEKLV
jgi:hypothetical protein